MAGEFSWKSRWYSDICNANKTQVTLSSWTVRLVTARCHSPLTVYDVSLFMLIRIYFFVDEQSEIINKSQMHNIKWRWKTAGHENGKTPGFVTLCLTFPKNGSQNMTDCGKEKDMEGNACYLCCLGDHQLLGRWTHFVINEEFVYIEKCISF